MREQTQQIPGRNRLSLRTDFEGRCNTAPEVAKQFLQRRENLLHTFVDLCTAGFGRARVGLYGPGVDGRGLRSPAGGSGLEFGQYAGDYQQMIGLSIELVTIAEHILLEQLEKYVLDLGLHTQIAPGLQEMLAEHGRPHRIVLIIKTLAEPRTQTPGTLAQG